MSNTPALDAYEALDVTNGSPDWNALMAQVPNEHFSNGRLTLTPEGAPEPAMLTPQMATWYRTKVAARRRAALGEVQQLFQASKFGNAPGFLLETAIAQAEQKRSQSSEQKITAFHRENQTLLKDLSAARTGYEQALVEHGGVAPVQVSPYIYWAGIIALIVGEFFLNAETIRSIPTITSPALAAALTFFGVALPVGFSAHVYGTVLRRWNYYFGPSARMRENFSIWYDGRLQLGLATTGLSVALGVVWWARHSYFMPILQECVLTGGECPNIEGMVGASLLANLGAWLAGVIWAYLLHDRDPDYLGFKLKFEQLQGRFDTKQERLNAELENFHSVERNTIEEKRKADRVLQGHAQYPGLRSQFDRFIAVDDSIVGALGQYRNYLNQHLQSQGASGVFVRKTVEFETGERLEELRADEYLAAPIVLKIL